MSLLSDAGMLLVDADGPDQLKLQAFPRRRRVVVDAVQMLARPSLFLPQDWSTVPSYLLSVQDPAQSWPCSAPVQPYLFLFLALKHDAVRSRPRSAPVRSCLSRGSRASFARSARFPLPRRRSRISSLSGSRAPPLRGTRSRRGRASSSRGWGPCPFLEPHLVLLQEPCLPRAGPVHLFRAGPGAVAAVHPPRAGRDAALAARSLRAGPVPSAAARSSPSPPEGPGPVTPHVPSRSSRWAPSTRCRTRRTTLQGTPPPRTRKASSRRRRSSRSRSCSRSSPGYGAPLPPRCAPERSGGGTRATPPRARTAPPRGRVIPKALSREATSSLCQCCIRAPGRATTRPTSRARTACGERRPSAPSSRHCQRASGFFFRRSRPIQKPTGPAESPGRSPRIPGVDSPRNPPVASHTTSLAREVPLSILGRRFSRSLGQKVPNFSSPPQMKNTRTNNSALTLARSRPPHDRSPPHRSPPLQAGTGTAAPRRPTSPRSCSRQT